MSGSAGGTDPAMRTDDLNEPDPIVADTQVQVPTPPATESADTVKKEDSVLTVTTEGEQKQEEKPDQKKVEAALREAGKLKQVQKELEKSKKDLERLRNIEQKALESPEKYKRALVDYNGMSESDAEKTVADLKQQGIWSNIQPSVPGKQPAATPIDPYKAAQEVLAQRDHQDRFFERLPELNPKNIQATQRNTMATFASAIEFEARRRITEDSTLDLYDEIENVYKEFTGKNDEQLKTAREEGRLQGAMERSTSKVSITKAPQGMSPKGDDSFGLTASEVAEAQAEGLSLKDFARLKDPVSIVG